MDDLRQQAKTPQALSQDGPACCFWQLSFRWRDLKIAAQERAEAFDLSFVRPYH
jgi:hypothetical protein